MVISALTRPALLHSVCDLKVTLMNAQCSLLYEFELSHKTAEETKNICWAKGEGAVTRFLKKFPLGFKNLDGQAKSRRRKTMCSEVLLQANEANLASGTRRVSSGFSISPVSGVHYFYTLYQISPRFMTSSDEKNKKKQDGTRPHWKPSAYPTNAMRGQTA